MTGTLFGLAPALFGSRANPNESLREGGRGSSLGKSPARSALIAAEIALSLRLARRRRTDDEKFRSADECRSRL